MKKTAFFSSIYDVIRKHKWTVLLFTVLIVIRFVWVDRFPPGMQYDEVEYSLSSKTFQMMGEDVSGVGFPESLLTTKTIGRVSPVPYMILAPLWTVIDLNMYTFRTVYVILNILTGIVFMGIVHELFRKKGLTILSGILFFINPWSFFLSRHAIDGAFVLFFLLLGLWFMLKPYSRKNIIWAAVFFLLGFFSYHGAKLQLVPLIAIISFYTWFKTSVKKRVMKPYVLLTLFFVFALVLFLGASSLMKGSILQERSHEIVFTNLGAFSDDVVKMRTASIETPLHPFLINKLYFAGRYLIENYLKAFSPSSLFYSAEIMKYAGFFFLIDAVFLTIGLLQLFIKKRPEFLLLFGIALIAPLSTAISMSGFSILNRGILLLPSLLIIMSYGVYSIFEEIKNRWCRKLYLLSATTAYIISFGIFLYTYFFIFPIELYGHYRVSTRALARYLSLETQKTQKIVITARNPRVLYTILTFFQPRDLQEEALRQGKIGSDTDVYTFGPVTVTDECITELDPNTTYIFDREQEDCYAESLNPEFMIINKIDAGIEYSIINGNTCAQTPLTRWVSPHFVSDFAIETMSEEAFCTRWVAGSTAGVLPKIKREKRILQLKENSSEQTEVN